MSDLNSKKNETNRLATEFCGIKFKNPIIPASGTFSYGMEYDEFYDISLLGGIACTATTAKPRLGNPAPRVVETHSGMLNSIGLQNPGVEAFLSMYLPWLRKKDVVVIVNVAGNSIEDYCEVTEKLADADIDMIELNVSCPNVKHGGANFGTSTDSVEKITAEIKKRAGNKPVVVKLTPNVTNIADIAAAAEQGGADGISLINTLTGMRIDVKTRRPLLKNNIGGLSGPAIFPVALRHVREVYKRVKIPVMGMGGVSTFTDVLEMMIAGAGLVQVGAANFRNPYACVEIIDGLDKYLAENNINNINEIVGTLEEW